MHRSKVIHAIDLCTTISDLSKNDTTKMFSVSAYEDFWNLAIQDSRLLYHLIREIETWLNINHIIIIYIADVSDGCTIIQ